VILIHFWLIRQILDVSLPCGHLSPTKTLGSIPVQVGGGFLLTELIHFDDW
jgi:hypothetical protein